MLRTDMLSAMAQHLGYQKLKQTTILRTNSPQAHLDYDTSVQEHNTLMRSFFESGTKMHNLWISHYGQNQQNQSGEVQS
ncbi:hypothetical protein [Flavobacterium sp. DG1-102-2]|uniref:hypothetical protein n=1 Tax=Flavobacterium sp. DG1-102-2 TaxID=3081663 RepID=UPI003981D008